ncbi:MAG: amino acid racemase [Bacteroidota bacterium]
MIGIVGGVGPYAGLDLLKKVFDNTHAACDQDHVDALLFSLPGGIMDRTEYLEGRVEENPASAIARVLLKLEQAGASVAGIPCNTAHVDPIFSSIRDELKQQGSALKLLHMIAETVSFIRSSYPHLTKIGVLSTTGTYRSRVYVDMLETKGYEVLVPNERMQENLIHPAIYDPVYGIKSLSGSIHPQAHRNLQKGFTALKDLGARGVILGCTEIPLAFPEALIEGMVSIDPTQVLARALLRETFPEKLKPLKLML